MNGEQKSTNIKPFSHKMFHFYLTKSVKFVDLSAVVNRTGSKILLGGKHFYHLNVEELPKSGPNVLTATGEFF